MRSGRSAKDIGYHRRVRETGSLTDSRFRLLLILVATLYFALQALYISHDPLVMDEFDGAAEAHQLTHAVPYRDYSPYKTVLGYYVQLPAVVLAPDVWSSLMLAKTEMALVNAVMLVLTGLLLARHLRKDAILLALIPGALMSTFLERSSDLRVDMLTAWVGLISLLLLIDRRYAMAGAFCGLSFLVSQKGALYFVAANAAIAVWFAIQKQLSSFLRPATRFNASWLAVLVVYIAFWSLLASPSKVIDATFLGHVAGTALGEHYDIRGRFWSQTLFRNPFFWGLAVVALWALDQRRRIRGPEYRQVVIFVYSSAILALGIWYRQPWPYFFVIILPAVWVLHAAFFDDQLGENGSIVRSFTPAMMLMYVVFGIACPAFRIPVNVGRDNSFQAANVRIAEAALAPHDTYFAGNDLVYTRSQTLPELSRLGSIVLSQLNERSTEELRPLLTKLNTHPPKLFIGNYRIAGLPEPIRQYLAAHYAHYWANVFSYAPLISPTEGEVAIAFAGDYAIDAPAGTQLILDDQTRHPREIVRLSPGKHSIRCPQPIRLRLQLPIPQDLLEPSARGERDFYPLVYDY